MLLNRPMLKVLLKTVADFRIYNGGSTGIKTDKAACQSEKHRNCMFNQQCTCVVDTRVKEGWLFWVDTSIVKRIVWMTG